jgi:nucleotide-binding universal stress UspA family protein
VYKNILVPLENSPTDEVILEHVRLLAKETGARLILIHVADGFQARNQQRFGESDEMRKDRAYLEHREAELRDAGLSVQHILAAGDPPAEVLAAAERENCDLIAMATHGHRFIADLLLGSVAEAVRHRARIPVLLLKA